ncbi:hypothetical protein DL771_008645 [Monosporascus sp. 5C6A]|nr:hypothetical protein DL771_008645 [Monosporascus sp. 5C6A]
MSTQRLFLTGGSGFIGSVVIEVAKKQQHDVFALSRTEKSDIKIRQLGATPVRGDLHSLEILEREATLSDAVIHLATAHIPTDVTFENAVPVDIGALNALARGLAGSGKPLVTCSGTLSAQPDPYGDETDETAPLQQPSPLAARYKVEAHALSLVSQGIRVCSVRIAANTYGRGGSIIKQYMASARNNGSVNCVDGARNHITACHVDDCAHLMLLVAQKGKAGEIYNASSSTTTTSRELSEAIAQVLDVPIRHITIDEARSLLGDIGLFFITLENRASGSKARQELGWHPTGVGLLEDIRHGSYLAVAAALKDSNQDTGSTYF